MNDSDAVKRSCRQGFLGCALAVLASPAAFAQPPGESADTVSSADPVGAGDIIVTAQKRSENLRDVPISIAALSGEQLARQGVKSADDLQKAVPGFTFKPARTGIPIYSIRGIGFDDYGVGSAPTVSVSVDQIPLPFLLMTPAAAMDVERVEVLKGPQGTLFGQNTTGGAVNFIAAKPTADPQMGFALTYGRFNQVDVSGYVSGPVSDTLRARVSAMREYRDAWQISDTRPRDRLGRRDFTAGRLLLDWTPTDELSIELNVNGWIDHSESQAAQYVLFSPTIPIPPGRTNSRDLIGNRPPTPDDARRADWYPGQSYRRDGKQYQFALRADWEASDAVTVTSLSSYVNLDSRTPIDTSGTDLHIFNVDQRGKIETFSQELRAAVDLSRVKLTLGANYQDDKTNDDFGVFFVVNNNAIGPFVWNRFVMEANQKVETYAAFASADLSLSDRLTVQGGIRYTKQNRDFNGCLRDGGDGNLAGGVALIPTLGGGAFDPAPPGGCVSLSPTLQRLPTVTDELNEDNISWRLGLNWKPNDDALVYANVTRGYKAGAFTPVPAIFAAQFVPVTQEKVTAYEVGAKAAFLDRKIDVAAAFFYSDYVNKQLLGNVIFPNFGPLPTLQNIPKSEVLGGEVNITARPVRGLSLAGGLTYVRSRVTEDFSVSDPLGIVVPSIKGEPFPNAPRWQGNAIVNYEFPVSSNLVASFGGDVSYRSSAQASFGRNPIFVYKAYTLVGLNAGIGAEDDRWRVEVWGKNITDKFYINNIFKAGDTVSRTTGMPATYGVTLRTRF